LSTNYARPGVGYFSTPCTRYSLNADERAQKLEGNMGGDALGNSVTLNLISCVVELFIVEMEVVVRLSRQNLFFLFHHTRI